MRPRTVHSPVTFAPPTGASIAGLIWRSKHLPVASGVQVGPALAKLSIAFAFALLVLSTYATSW